MIITRTPFRVSFFGGGSDYPAWLEENGGAVLATTINKYCYISTRYLPPFFQNRYRIVWSEIETCSSIDEIVHPVVREVLRAWKFDEGLEIHHDGDLPARSGMGSSSAFTVGFLHSMYALTGRMIGPEDLAREAIRMEQEVLSETVGCQDQITAAFGGFNKISFSGPRRFSVTPVSATPERMDELNCHLLLVYTGISRTASEVANNYVAQLAGKSKHLNRMIELVDEALALLGGSTPIADFGVLLDETWRRKKELARGISNGRIDEIYQTALETGAIGGKLLGAGGGGFLLIFVPPRQRADVSDRLSSLTQVPFKFESRGSQVIFMDRQEDFGSSLNHAARATGSATP